MAFPSVVATNGGTGSTASPTINLPAGIQAGDLLLAIVSVNNFQVSGSGWPTGWIALLTNSIYGADSLSIRYKIATGSEGASFVLTLLGAGSSSHATYRITGWHGTTPPEVVASPVVATNTNPNPPSLNPAGWDVEDTLWLAVVGTDAGNVSATAAPSGYTNLLNYRSGSLSPYSGVSSAQRGATIAAEDPGTFTLSASGNYATTTVAIRPAAGPILSAAITGTGLVAGALTTSAYPEVVATNGGGVTATQSTHPINLPAGLQAGDLLIVVFACRGTSLTVTPTGPAMTNMLKTEFATADTIWIGYRMCDGSESSLSIGTSVAGRSCHATYRITGHHPTTPPTHKTLLEGSSAAPDDPAALNPPAWDVENTLWLACAMYDNGSLTATAYPANYVNGQNPRTTVSTGPGLAMAQRALNVASEDAGAFTLSASTAWGVTTLAIRPAPPPTGATLGGALTGTGLVAGDLTATTTLAAGLTGAATVAGSLQTGALLAASLTGAATTAGALQVGSLLGASVAGAATAAGSLATELRLAAAVQGTGLVAGSLTAATTLSGAVLGTGLVAGAIATELRLVGSVSGIATSSGALTVSGALLVGAVAGIATTAGNLSTLPVGLAAVITGTATVAGSLQVGVDLSSAIQGTATLVGALSVGGPSATLAGSALGSATLGGSLTTATPAALAGAALGTATVAGDLRIGGPLLLVGDVRGLATVLGDLSVPTTATELAGDLVGVAVLVGVLFDARPVVPVEVACPCCPSFPTPRDEWDWRSDPNPAGDRVSIYRTTRPAVATAGRRQAWTGEHAERRRPLTTTATRAVRPRDLRPDRDDVRGWRG
jgi:hypothetical protein